MDETGSLSCQVMEFGPGYVCTSPSPFTALVKVVLPIDCTLFCPLYCFLMRQLKTRFLIEHFTQQKRTSKP
jgi:hypothetical protein